MPNQPKGTNTEEIEWKYALIERLKELIDETGGDAEFAKKLNSIQLKGSTTATVLNRWKDPEKDIQLKNIYLIANACNVSVDWLLGLSEEKFRCRKSFTHPVTYGNALSILNNLIKINVIEIDNSSGQKCEMLDDDNNDILPTHIQINDEHLIDLLKDLYRSQGLSERRFIDTWEKITLKLNKPIQDIQAHDGNPNHNDMKSGQATGKETAVYAKFLDDNDLKEQVAKQLGKLKNDLSGAEWGNKLGIHKNTVNGWFGQKSHLPETSHIYIIAKAYAVHVDWILGLEEAYCMDLPWGDEMYTYGSVLSMLKDLIDKGTIGFVQEYIPSFDNLDDDCNDDYAPIIEDHLVIDDPFLFGLLLDQSKPKQYSTKEMKETLEESGNKYKDYPLLFFKKDTRYGSYKTIRSDLSKILHNVWDGNTDHEIDLDKLYKDLQKLCGLKPDK